MKTLLVALILCTPLTLLAADKANADVLNRWIGGKWPLDGKMLDTDYSKAMTVTGVSNCGWSPDHIFMICDQSINEAGKPSRELSIYVYDPDNATFHFYGSHLAAAGRTQPTRPSARTAIVGNTPARLRSRVSRCSSAPSMTSTALITSTGGRSIPPTAGPPGSRWAEAQRRGRSNRFL